MSALIGLATGKAGLVTVTETGELYLAIPLADWERVVASATAYQPCAAGECTGHGCELARAVLAVAAEVQS